MKHISSLALAVMLGGASIHADQQLPVRMTFSGTGTYLAPQINLVPGGNSPLIYVSFAGDGTLGPFSLNEVSATTAMPTNPGCAGANSLGFTWVAAAGALRFRDGSILTYKLKAGTVCIDFTKGSASDTVTEDITGGTGRFKNASGTLTFTTTADYPILFDATGQQPIMTVIPNGLVTGTIVLPDPQ
jgi:hypothetical protein